MQERLTRPPSREGIVLRMAQGTDSTGVVVYGAGGHAKVILDILEKQGRYEVLAVIDENPKTDTLLGYPVLRADAKTWPAERGVIAIGDNFTRRKVVDQLRRDRPNFRFVSAIHPSAQIARDVEIGEGTVVMAGAIINTSSRIGAHCILNTRCSIDHDALIGDYASFGPGAVTGGLVVVGEGAAIALGALCLHKVKIGRDCVIGAGSVVTRDVDASTVAYGNPCRPVRTRAAGDRYL